MTKVTEGVYFIQGQDEFIPDSHVYIVGEPASEDFSLVDDTDAVGQLPRLSSLLPVVVYNSIVILL